MILKAHFLLQKPKSVKNVTLHPAAIDDLIFMRNNHLISRHRQKFSEIIFYLTEAETPIPKTKGHPES